MLMKKKKPFIVISDDSSKGTINAAKPHSQSSSTNNNPNTNPLNNQNSAELALAELQKKGPKEYKMTEEEKELNRKILKNMNRKQNFVKNPRFRNNAKCMLYSNALFSDILSSENPFVVEPIIVTFREYQLNCVYQLDLKLTNRKQILTSFKFIPPVTENFSVKKIIYPKKDTGLIAPGMHAKLEILFNATSLDNFEDEISIITEMFAFRVPLRGIRELPALSLDNPMICGKCLLGDQTSMVFRCKNNGGDAHFKFNVKEEFHGGAGSNNHFNSSEVHGLQHNNFLDVNGNSNSNQISIANNSNHNNNNNNNNLTSNAFGNNITGAIQTVSHLHANNNNNNNNNALSEANNQNNLIHTLSSSLTNQNQNNYYNNNNLNQQDNEVLNVGPFSIFPQEFYLYKGMSVEVYVNFNPQTEGMIERDLTICCDSKINLDQKIIGEGISIDFQIISLDGIPVDESIEKLENLYFEDAYPSTVSSRRLQIKNLSSVPLRFHWSIYDMYENKTFSLQEEEDYFMISPLEGVFEPLQEISFVVNFQPKNSRNYEQKLDLIIEDVPFQAVKNFNPHLLLGRNSAKKSNYSYGNSSHNGKESKSSSLNSPLAALKKNTFTKGEPFLLALNSPYPSYPIFSFNLKGKGKQCYLDVSSKIIDFGVVFIGEKISRNFSLFNPKSGLIKFRISKILQSISKKAVIGDSDPAAKVNNFFKWSEPGSTVTDHFRTNCIFKLKKPNEDNLEKLLSKMSKEFNLHNLNNAVSNNNLINNLNSLDLLSDNDIGSVKASVNNDNYRNLILSNSKTNSNKLISDINLGNFALGFNSMRNGSKNYVCFGEKPANGNFQDEVDYLKLYVAKEFLFRKERKMSHQPRKKWVSKVKNYLRNSASGNKINSIHANNNHNLNSKSMITSEENNLSAQNSTNINNNNLGLAIANTKIIKRDLSNDSAKNGRNPKSIAATKQIERISIKSAVSKAKEKDGNNNNNNLNNLNNVNNLNLQNSLIVDETSFHNKPLPTRTNVAKSASGTQSTSGKERVNTHSNSRLTHVDTRSKSNNQTLTHNSDEITVEENLDLQIKKDEILKVNLTFLPSKLGQFKSSIIVSPDDGVPFSIDFKASVVGPKITVDTPCIDFGLFAVNEVKTAKFLIKNASRTVARYLIKESRFKNINFENYIDSDYVIENEGVIHEPKVRRKIQTLKDFENYGLREMDIDVVDNYEIKFSPIFGTIQENQEQEITVSFVSAYPKYKLDQIEIMVMHSDSVFVNYHADCQEAFAYLSKTLIVPKNIYVSVPITFENNSLQIINPSNLPVSFEWENANIEDEKYIEFSPVKGTIQPRSYVDVSYRMIFYSIKEIDEIYYCKINELDVPLGVNLKGVVTGLDIIYELTDESFNQFNMSKFESLSMHSSLTGNSMIRRTLSLKENRKLSFLDNNFHADKTLKFLDFKNLKVNKSHSIKFIVKNLSGIATHFYFESKNFNPGIEKDLKYNITRDPHQNASAAQLSIYNSTHSSNLNNNNKNKNNLASQNEMNTTTTKNNFNNNTSQNLTLNRKSFFGGTKAKKLHIGHPLLSDYHESINFTSAKGNEFTKMRQLEKDSVLYLSSKKGVAITIEPKQGRLDPHSDQLVTVTIYNECVGDFEDELIANIKGLAERRFPISLRIRGNPLQLAPFQPGIDYALSPPILKMGYVTTNVNSISKTFKVINTGANLISLDWKIFDYEDVLNPKGDIFKVKVSQSRNKEKFSLSYVACEPPEKEDFGNFKIKPQNVLIQPKGTQDLSICFSTDAPGIKSALLVAYPKFLDDSKTLNVRLSELALKVDAFGVKPDLVVDKKIDFEGNYRYRFYLHSYGINPKPKRSIVLINQEKINLNIRVHLEGPYKITSTEPLEASVGMDGKSFNIIPKSNLKIELKAFIPDPKNLEDWPITLVNEKHGKLTVIFENGEFKEYLLTTVLKRPRISLNTTGNDAIEGPNYIDFGSVNCESYKKASVFLKNITDVLTDWQINYVKFKPKKYYGYGTTTTDEKEDIAMTDDPDMFLFNVTSGEIHGPSIMLVNIPLGPGLPQVPNENNKKYLPVRIDIMFKPKKNIFYKCRYKITTSTGNSIDFMLKGYGSYLEERIEN